MFFSISAQGRNAVILLKGPFLPQGLSFLSKRLRGLFQIFDKPML
jgi:hypothetical protein